MAKIPQFTEFIPAKTEVEEWIFCYT
jgi:hypothetical protein